MTGDAIAVKINSGYGTYYTYNDAGLLLTKLSPVSKDNNLSFDVQYTYDALGRKLTETNANHVVTHYYYDNAGRVIRTSVTDTTEKVLQQNTYDAMGNILTQTDGNGNTTTFSYNRLGLLKSQTASGDVTIDLYTVNNQYNSLGQLVCQKDSLGKILLYTYDHNGNTLSRSEQAEDGTQSITARGSYDKNGNLRFSTDANGVTTEYIYDKLNRVKKTIIEVGGETQVTTNTYDLNGNQTSVTDWLGNTYTNEYDALNRLVKKTDPYGKVIGKYEYNNNHAQTKAYDALNNATVYAYDKNNRLTSTTDPAGNITSQTYDKVSNIETKTDGNGSVTTYAYDAFNHLSKVTNAKEEDTYYSYDLNGNLLTQTDAKGNITTYTYNSANKVVTKVDPGLSSVSGRTVSYTYYADGTVKTKTDRNGNTTTYLYDIHGKLVSETIGNSTYTYTYNSNGNMLTMTDDTGTTTRTYDEKGRVITKNVPDIGTISFEYDILVMDTETGDVTGCYKEKSTDPKGNITYKVYDKAGRLSEVITGEDVTAYTYYDNGNRKSIIYNDGSKEVYTYTANNKVETLVNKEADQNVMDSYSYTYDQAGNQLTKQETINGIEKGTTSYTYDSLNRLLTITEPNGRVTAYAYDMAGNRCKETIVITDSSNGDTVTTENTYTYNEQNRLTDITTRVNNVITKVAGYTYDNNGNQLTTSIETYTDGTVTETETTLTNTYDVRNQLIRTVTQDNTIVNSTYNAEGYRVTKEVIKNSESGTESKKNYYLYEADKVILEVDEAGNQTARNVYGTNLLIRQTEGENYYYMYNGHADVTVLINEEGTIAATYYYDAFGNILESTGDVNNSILYAGYQYDVETGLYYLNARMYDPVTARFLQEDTYTGDKNDPLSLNLYTYCDNNPIIYVDPSGHKKKDNTVADYFVDVNLNKTPYIKVGASGSYVLQSEKWLKKLGYNVKVDGKFSEAEAKALTQYEIKNKLKVTNGIIDNKTYSSLMASNLKDDAKDKGMSQTQLKNYNRSVDNLLKQTQYQNPDYTKDFYSYNYNNLVGYFGGGVEIYNALISLYPGGDAVDIAAFANDLVNYKKGAEWKLVADLTALGIDGVGNFSDEIIDAAKKAKKTAEEASKTAISRNNINSNLEMNLQFFASEGASTTGADNIATGPKLNAQLTYEEASSVFTKSGILKPEVVKNSSAIIPGSELKNINVRNALTENGSNINDWAKMTTQTFKNPSGNFQVHFYQNLKTGEVSTYEMKVKFCK